MALRQGRADWGAMAMRGFLNQYSLSRRQYLVVDNQFLLCSTYSGEKRIANKKAKK